MKYNYKLGNLKVNIPEGDLNPEMNIELGGIEISVEDIKMSEVIDLIREVKSSTKEMVDYVRYAQREDQEYEENRSQEHEERIKEAFTSAVNRRTEAKTF